MTRYAYIGLFLVGLAAIVYVLMSAATGKPAGNPFEAYATGQMTKLDFASAGQPMPEGSFTAAEGNSLTLETFKGKTILVNYWATWCPPCEKEMPSLGALQTARAGDAFEVIALSVDSDEDVDYAKRRLIELGARNPDTGDSVIFPPPVSPSGKAAGPAGAVRPELHYYLSFRSPYTYIVAQRAKALADAYGAELKLRYVLPMVMRGLPVPPDKRNYITLDAARQARRVGVPFGRVADPVGRPVERGYSLLPWAVREGRGFDYCLAFMRAVWSQGVDAGSDAGMRRIVEAAGLSWVAARAVAYLCRR